MAADGPYGSGEPQPLVGIVRGGDQIDQQIGKAHELPVVESAAAGERRDEIRFGEQRVEVRVDPVEQIGSRLFAVDCFRRFRLCKSDTGEQGPEQGPDLADFVQQIVFHRGGRVRGQRLSPLPVMRWRSMRERSFSTFVRATSSRS